MVRIEISSALEEPGERQEIPATEEGEEPVMRRIIVFEFLELSTPEELDDVLTKIGREVIKNG